MILMSGLAALTPASKPAWNVWISGTLTPPMKPTLSVLVCLPAATPTRNEPSSAAKIREVTFGTSTSDSSSTIAKLMSGLAAATSVMGPE